jgi:hypothetical protein
LETLESVVDAIGLVVTLLYLAAIPVCFMKGRPGFGLFGVVTFVLGMVVGFPLFRHLRETSAEEWFWLWRIEGLVIGVVMIVAAARPAKPGSWWERRFRRETAAP